MNRKLLGFLIILATYSLIACTDETYKPKQIDDHTKTESAIFAGGCFWCTESDFEKVNGVIEVISGYSGGESTNPTYKQVASGQTNHIESVKVIYDPSKVNYEELLHVFWTHIDPTDNKGQFVDRGMQYRPVIFFGNEQEKAFAEKTRDYLDGLNIFTTKINTDIIKEMPFYIAEEYHQDYYKKNNLRYSYYRISSGRDTFLETTWRNHENVFKKKTKYTRKTNEELKSSLTPIQYKIVREDFTEKPFNNEYWDNNKKGIYVDITNGQPLFSSKDKYKSGTGWPSFSRPINDKALKIETDYKAFFPREEVRTDIGDTHLGHVFKDGPQPTGLRYCLNSGALRFVAYENLKSEGYEDYLNIF